MTGSGGQVRHSLEDLEDELARVRRELREPREQGTEARSA